MKKLKTFEVLASEALRKCTEPAPSALITLAVGIAVNRQLEKKPDDNPEVNVDEVLRQIRDLISKDAAFLSGKEDIPALTPPPAPPKYAEFIVQLLANPAHVDAAVGDLDERFRRDCLEFGPERARRCYWGRVCKSLLPLLGRAAARAIRLAVLIAAARRLLS
jgi:hypothetical protein